MHTKFIILAGVALLCLAALLYRYRGLVFAPAVRKQPADATGAPGPSLYSFTFLANDGTVYDLAQHRGRPVLLVNTASRCGFTGQYAGLQEAYERYGGRGLVVMAVPSNDFQGQEPGSDGEIREFCTVNFGVTFPLMAKVQVAAGEGQHAFYRWLTTTSSIPGAVPWNFEKVLFNGQGDLVARFHPRVPPLDKRIVRAVEALLD